MKHILKESLIISLVTIFVLSFLQPFGIEQMRDDRLIFIGWVSLLTLAVSVMSFVLSGRVFHGRLFSVRRLMMFYAIFVPVLSVLILSSVSWFRWGNLYTSWYCTQGAFSVFNYLIVCLQVSLISLFIFIVHLYRARNSSLQDELETLREMNRKLEQAVKTEPACQQTETETVQPETSNEIVLRGNTVNSVMTLQPENLIFIEAMSNYANVCMLKDDQQTYQTLRITMRQLRETLCQCDYLFACHRAFIVNLHFVQAISGRRSTGYILQIYGTEKCIPVSRSLSDDFEQRWNRIYPDAQPVKPVGQ